MRCLLSAVERLWALLLGVDHDPPHRPPPRPRTSGAGLVPPQLRVQGNHAAAAGHHRGAVTMLPHDKALHIVVGSAIFSAAYVLFTLAGLPALHIAAGAVMLAAVGKEVYDYLNRDKHTPDFMDAVATIAGGVVVFLPLIAPTIVKTFFTFTSSLFTLIPILN